MSIGIPNFKDLALHVQVLIAVVVVVKELGAPAKGVDLRVGGCRGVGKHAGFAIVAQKVVSVGFVADVNVEVTVPVVIRHSTGHGPDVVANPSRESDIGEGVVAFVLVEGVLVGSAIVDDEQVLVAIAVVVDEDRLEAGALTVVGT